MRRRAAALLAALCAVGSAAAAGGGVARAQVDCPLPVFGPGAGYRPQISPAGFSPVIDNPWLPMTPGRVWLYTGHKDGERALDVVAPSQRTRVIAGVTTRIVEDHLYLDGRLAERTSDYYAQDACGNV